MSAHDYAKTVADQVIKQLEEGTAPWIKPWAPGELRAPYNPTTDNPYRGMNALWLSMQGRGDPRWLTYKQAAGLGAQVQKGSRGCHIEYWKFHEDRPKLGADGKPILGENGRAETVRVELDRPRRFTAVVFNAEQIEGLAPLPTVAPRPEPERHERAEAIITNSGAKVRHVGGDRAYYAPGTDSITLPERHQFSSGNAYYATALHELGHWTGHQSRLDRDLSHPFGSEGYAKEELRAEIASLMLGEQLGLGHDPGQHVAYIGSWIKALQDDPREIFRAAADADKIGRFVLNFEHVQQKDAAPEKEAEKTAAPESWTNTDRSRFFIDGPEGGPDLSFDNLTEAVASFNKNGRGTYPLKIERGDRADTLIGHDWYNDGSNHRHRYATPAMKQLHEAVRLGRAADQIADAERAALQSIERPQTVRTRQQEAPAMANDPVTESRTYLAVPFAEKNEAKKIGAKWDVTAKSWYAPEGTQLHTSGLSRWLPAPDAAKPKPAAVAPEKAFADELARHGLVVTGLPIMDGKLYRVPVEGDKGSERSGAYVGHLDGAMPAGFVQNYKTGEANNWRYPEDGVSPLSDAEKVEALAVAAANKQKREVEKVKAQDDASTAARLLWSESSQAPDGNAYCQKKQIAAPGAKGLREVPPQVSASAYDAGIRVASTAQQAKDMREAEPNAYVFRRGDLLVPLFDEAGEVHGVQAVNPWFKGFMRGARKAGLHSVAGGDAAAFHDAMQKNPAMPIVIGEGYATGDTLSQSLGHPVIVGLNSGNLGAVARQMRERYPDRQMIVAADNDPKIINGRTRNVGVEKATAAAEANGGVIIVPDKTNGSDWNDYAAEHGAQRAARVIAERIEKAKAEAAISSDKMRYFAHERIADAQDNPATSADNDFVARERDKATKEIVAATGREDNIRAGLVNTTAARSPGSTRMDASGTARHLQSARDQVREERAEVLDGTNNSTEESPAVKLTLDAERKRAVQIGRSRGRGR